jgi:hypothetical protein
MKKTCLSDKEILFEFDSVADFVEYSSKGPENGDSRAEYLTKIAGGTWEQALEQAVTGNPELVQEIAYKVGNIEGMIEKDAPGWIRDVTGDFFDVADFLSGEPEVFRREEMSEVKKVVPVYANFGMSHNISNDVIKNRGCAIIALVDELQRAGFIAELSLVFGSRYNGISRYIKINISQDPADLDAAAFVLANPMCLRRVYLAFLERECNRRNCSGYGCPIEFPVEKINGTEELGGINFGSSSSGFFDERDYYDLETAKDHVETLITEFAENPGKLVQS